MMSEDFHKFFDRSTRLVERALCEMSDGNLFVDYTGGYGDDDHEGLDGDKSNGGNKLSLNRCFYDERWTKNRVITSMDWSTTFPELLVTSYDKNSESAHDPDGMCLVWNTRFKKSTPGRDFKLQSRPEFRTCSDFEWSMAFGLRFHPFKIGTNKMAALGKTSNDLVPMLRGDESPLHFSPAWCINSKIIQIPH